MEQLSLSIINLRTNKETALAAQQIYLNKSPFFQRSYEAWDDKLRTRFIESIILNRATNPIWTVLNDVDESEEILDGMHRITTALSFLNNEFAINKTHLLTLDAEKYHKRTFKELDADDRAKIRNYNFTFNKLDSSYRTDLNKLKDMYEILNRSSRTLNDYEFNKVILGPFYDIIGEHKDQFVQSGFFERTRDSRGNIETDIIEMIAFSDSLRTRWHSINQIKDEWITENMGDTFESVAKYARENGDTIRAKLAFMCKIIPEFYQRKMFSDDARTFRHAFSCYKFIISRCCHLVPNYAVFNRILPAIVEQFRQHVLVEDIQAKLECTSRSGGFQRKVIERIDAILEKEVNAEGSVRRFTKKAIDDKLAEQSNVCPLCNLAILATDKYEGDHIVPWTAGGKTLADNLQVVHKRCHQLKSV
jgi:hypothetical protein